MAMLGLMICASCMMVLKIQIDIWSGMAMMPESWNQARVVANAAALDWTYVFPNPAIALRWLATKHVSSTFKPFYIFFARARGRACPFAQATDPVSCSSRLQALTIGK
jgi:hypothetical protein